MTATTTTAVEFSKLVAGGEINARSTGKKEGLSELAASIKAKGLIQPLVVRPLDKGKFQIIAGNRRHAAIGRLVKEGAWPKMEPVPVIVRTEDDAEALETSLAENSVRLPLHPVEQFEVFAKLTESEKVSPAEIAARFGITEKTVKQHMACGRLAPEVREAWRKGKIDAKTAQAFTICTDQDLQAKAFARLRRQGHISDHFVKQELSNDAPTLDSKEVEFIGLDRYKAAGGSVVESLFEEQSYIADGALLKSLVAERLDEEVARIKKQGWSFVCRRDEMPQHWWPNGNNHRVEPAYTAKEKKKVADLTKELEEGEGGEEADKLEAQLQELEQVAALRAYTPELKAKTGCVVELGWNSLEVHYAVTRDGDIDDDGEKQGEVGATGEPDTVAGDLDAGDGQEERDEGHGQEEETEAEPSISNALALSLTELLTTAAARALVTDPALALRVAVAALTSGGHSSPVKLHSTGYAAKLPSGSFVKRLNGTAAEKDVAQAFADCVAEALDLRRHNAGARAEGAEALIAALPADVYLAAARDVFQPEDYFKRASAAMAIRALEEMRDFVPALNAPVPKKKADLVAVAVVAQRSSGWLPPELRHPEYRLAQPADVAPARKKGKGR